MGISFLKHLQYEFKFTELIPKDPLRLDEIKIPAPNTGPTCEAVESTAIGPVETTALPKAHRSVHKAPKPIKPSSRRYVPLPLGSPRMMLQTGRRTSSQTPALPSASKNKRQAVGIPPSKEVRLHTGEVDAVGQSVATLQPPVVPTMQILPRGSDVGQPFPSLLDINGGRAGPDVRIPPPGEADAAIHPAFRGIQGLLNDPASNLSANALRLLEPFATTTDEPDPGLTPLNLCCFCDEEMPANPLQKLVDLGTYLKNRPGLTPDTYYSAQFPQTADYCRMHTAQTKLMPMGVANGWPVEIDFESLTSRVASTEHHLWLVARKMTSSHFMDAALENWSALGKRKALSVFGDFGSFEVEQPG
ncbi:hypothetical protein PGTUg99_028615 [Puccinia graminis f. sp. tritici]|uniref:Uncharacterized protein n=1 Tax=Puccinia graminis f. sp. tritici TaxID=56615 RepID=A0A5B0R8Z6_PUCGR|nr:hypothetical protein PGTUg99_028615 [Puccinia graminis f. sp. tritici]